MPELEVLRDRLHELAPMVVAFSGGADSAFLAYVAHDTLGAERVTVATAVSPSLADDELSDCRALAFPIPFSTIAWLVYSGFPALLPPRSASVLIDPWILDWALCLLRSHARFALSRVQYFPQNPGIGLRTVAAGPLNCSTSTGQLP